MPDAADYVVLVEVLEIIGSLEDFAAASQAAVARLEREGVRELVSIRFLLEPHSREVGAILIFSDRERMMDHIRQVSAWDEFRLFFSMVRPLDVRVYGRLTPEAEAWIAQFDVLSKRFEEPVAGFVR
jgi:hypothetical protein